MRTLIGVIPDVVTLRETLNHQNTVILWMCVYACVHTHQVCTQTSMFIISISEHVT